MMKHRTGTYSCFVCFRKMGALPSLGNLNVHDGSRVKKAKKGVSLAASVKLGL